MIILQPSSFNDSIKIRLIINVLKNGHEMEFRIKVLKIILINLKLEIIFPINQLSTPQRTPYKPPRRREKE